MNESKTTLKEELRKGRSVVTYTSGVSMEPLLYENQTYVVVQSLIGEDGSARLLEAGELPIYLRPDGKYVIHRLIRMDADYYYTRGDNCLSAERIPKEWAIGVVAEIFRHGKCIKVTDKKYRVYVWVWTAIFPIRAILRRLKIAWKSIGKKLWQR